MEFHVHPVNGAANAADESAGALLPSLIYEQLRADIVAGALPSGQVLRQQELAKRLNVSRMPLREALTRLVAEGLIVPRPQRGYAVAELDASAIVDVFDLRMVIEQHAGEAAARARRPSDIDAVAELLDRMSNLNPGRKDYAQQWAALNYRFHQRIIESTQRKVLIRVAKNLRDAVEPYVNIEVVLTQSFDASEREHREIFEAFRAGDASGLADLSRRHVEGTAQRLLKELRERALKGKGRDES